MLLCFFIYSFLGWCVEVVYAAVKTGKFVNRGFLNGPYCPIYGFGVILVVSVLEPVKGNIFYLFFGSVLITSLIELIVGFTLEKIFHDRWWDYSDRPFNIGGYICLMFSLVWGLACLIVVDRIHPLIISLVNSLPMMLKEGLLVILTCLLLIDYIVTVISISKLNKKLEIIDELSLKIRKVSDNIGVGFANSTIAIVHKKENLEESIETKKEAFKSDMAEMKEAQKRTLNSQKQTLSELRKSSKEILEATTFGQRRLLKAFPDLRSLKHKDALEKLKKFTFDRKDK